MLSKVIFRKASEPNIVKQSFSSNRNVNDKKKKNNNNKETIKPNKMKKM